MSRLLFTGCVVVLMFGIPATPVAAQTPVSCDTVIVVPGNYIVTGDQTCTAFGIQVDANNVHINFNGHTLTGPGSGFGIHTSTANDLGLASCTRVTGLHVNGGTLTGFLTGIRLCVAAPTTMNAHVNGMTVRGNSRFGIVIINSDRNHVNGSTISGNGGSNFGIGVVLSAANNNRFNTNQVRDNTTVPGADIPRAGGYWLTGGSSDNVITGNDISSNGALDGEFVNTEFSFGVLVGPGSSGNTVRGNILDGNVQDGIRVGGNDNTIQGRPPGVASGVYSATAEIRQHRPSPLATLAAPGREVSSEVCRTLARLPRRSLPARRYARGRQRMPLPPPHQTH